MLAPPNSVFGIFVVYMAGPAQRQSAMNLKQHADFFKKIQTKDLKKSLLPPQVTYNNKIITAPNGWLPTDTPER
jgi:hypothetical protein